MSLVQLHDVEDLRKLLFLQKSIGQRVKNELTTIYNDGLIASASDDSTLEAIIEAGRVLLERYAKYPTLSEFEAIPSLAHGTKWGATFGVGIIVGELVLRQAQIRHPALVSTIRPLYMLLLGEFVDPQSTYLIEPLLKAISIKVKADMDEEAQREALKDTIQQLVKTFIIFSVRYGIIKGGDGDGGFRITPNGKRVFMHMIDSERVIKDIVEFHKKLQEQNPKLSMV